MIDQYLFKAKTWQGKWVQGFLFQVYDNEIYAIGTSRLSPNDYGEIQGEHTTWFTVDPTTICRCTGLSDKEGTLIWENDICDRGEKFPEIVNYNEGDWQLDYSYVFGRERGSDACNLGFYAIERKSVKVIGNIFDNAELLEVKR